MADSDFDDELRGETSMGALFGGDWPNMKITQEAMELHRQDVVPFESIMLLAIGKLEQRILKRLDE